MRLNLPFIDVFCKLLGKINMNYEVSNSLTDAIELIRLVEHVLDGGQSNISGELPIRGVMLTLGQVKEKLYLSQSQLAANNVQTVDRTESRLEQSPTVNSSSNGSMNNGNSGNAGRGGVKSKGSIADRIQQSPVNVSGVTRVRELLSNVGATVAKGSAYGSGSDQD